MRCTECSQRSYIVGRNCDSANPANSANMRTVNEHRVESGFCDCGHSANSANTQWGVLWLQLTCLQSTVLKAALFIGEIAVNPHRKNANNSASTREAKKQEQQSFHGTYAKVELAHWPTVVLFEFD